MRLFATGLFAALLAGLFLHAADKDSQAAASTRKKLDVKITVDFKDDTLDDIIKELSNQINAATKLSLSWKADNGVSRNQKLTFAAKDKTVANVLDGLLKKNSLGYIVISKPGDRYDGFLLIKQGNERGYAAGEEPKGKAPAKTESKEKKADKAEEKSPPNDEDRAEKAATGKLNFARDLIKDGKKDRAKQRLQELIRDYPNTKAAGEAKKELDKLGG